MNTLTLLIVSITLALSSAAEVHQLLQLQPDVKVSNGIVSINNSIHDNWTILINVEKELVVFSDGDDCFMRRVIIPKYLTLKMKSTIKQKEFFGRQLIKYILIPAKLFANSKIPSRKKVKLLGETIADRCSGKDVFILSLNKKNLPTYEDYVRNYEANRSIFATEEKVMDNHRVKRSIGSPIMGQEYGPADLSTSNTRMNYGYASNRGGEQKAEQTFRRNNIAYTSPTFATPGEFRYYNGYFPNNHRASSNYGAFSQPPIEEVANPMDSSEVNQYGMSHSQRIYGNSDPATEDLNIVKNPGGSVKFPDTIIKDGTIFYRHDESESTDEKGIDQFGSENTSVINTFEETGKQIPEIDHDEDSIFANNNDSYGYPYSAEYDDEQEPKIFDFVPNSMKNENHRPITAAAASVVANNEGTSAHTTGSAANGGYFSAYAHGYDSYGRASASHVHGGYNGISGISSAKGYDITGETFAQVDQKDVGSSASQSYSENGDTIASASVQRMPDAATIHHFPDMSHINVNSALPTRGINYRTSTEMDSNENYDQNRQVVYDHDEHNFESHSANQGDGYVGYHFNENRLESQEDNIDSKSNESRTGYQSSDQLSTHLTNGVIKKRSGIYSSLGNQMIDNIMEHVHQPGILTIQNGQDKYFNSEETSTPTIDTDGLSIGAGIAPNKAEVEQISIGNLQEGSRYPEENKEGVTGIATFPYGETGKPPGPGELLKQNKKQSFIQPGSTPLREQLYDEYEYEVDEPTPQEIKTLDTFNISSTEPPTQAPIMVPVFPRYEFKNMVDAGQTNSFMSKDDQLMTNIQTVSSKPNHFYPKSTPTPNGDKLVNLKTDEIVQHTTKSRLLVPGAQGSVQHLGPIIPGHPSIQVLTVGKNGYRRYGYKEGTLLQPGEQIPGTSGYRVPPGFRARVIFGSSSPISGLNAKNAAITTRKHRRIISSSDSLNRLRSARLSKNKLIGSYTYAPPQNETTQRQYPNYLVGPYPNEGNRPGNPWDENWGQDESWGSNNDGKSWNKPHHENCGYYDNNCRNIYTPYETQICQPIYIEVLCCC